MAMMPTIMIDLEKQVSFVIAVNDPPVFRNSFLASPILQHSANKDIVVQEGYTSAALAYNDGMNRAKNDLIVFAHQDVYFPECWLRDLAHALTQLADLDPHWGVLGCFGMTQDRRPFGYLYSTGLAAVLGRPLARPVEVQTLDEIVLIVRRSI